MQLIYLPKLTLKIEGFVWDNKVVEEGWPRTVLPLLQRYHMTRFSRWRKTLSVIQIPAGKNVQMTPRLILLRNTHADS